MDDITNLIFEHYKEGIKKNIIKLIGSTNLLGNPTRFVRTLGVGVTDFVMKPV